MSANDVVVRAPEPRLPRGRWRVHGAWALALAVAVGATWWATWALSQPAGATASSPSAPATFVAAEGEIGQQATVVATVTFAPGLSVAAGRDGVVTSIGVDPATPIAAGSVLVTVDLRPVIAFAGAVPAFRDLASGLRGPDVSQLRAALGLPAGDRFDATTVRAVRSWQRTLGVEPTGVVALGDVAFVPSLPIRGVVAEDVSIGARVTAGQALVDTVAERPSVTVPADSGGGRVAPGMAATFTVADTAYSGSLGTGDVGDDGLTTYAILDAEGSSPCDPACAATFPVQGSSQVEADIQIVDTVTGIVVPSSAIGVQPDGSRAVRASGGGLMSVVVVAESDGMAVVDGVPAGTVVLLFGDAP